MSSFTCDWVSETNSENLYQQLSDRMHGKVQVMEGSSLSISSGCEPHEESENVVVQLRGSMSSLAKDKRYRLVRYILLHTYVFIFSLSS